MNKNITVAIALIVVFIAGIAGYLVTTNQESMSPMATMPGSAGAPVPVARPVDTPVQFALNDIDGNLRELSEWQGRARLINFWATWCAPCRREIPLLKQTQTDHAADNIQIIGIAVDFPEEVKAYAEEAQFNYPILVGQEDAMSAAEDAGVPFIGLPFTMIVAPTGELLTSHVGEIMESHIDTIVAVFDDLESGRLDIAAAREALSEL